MWMTIIGTKYEIYIVSSPVQTYILIYKAQ